MAVAFLDTADFIFCFLLTVFGRFHLKGYNTFIWTKTNLQSAA